MMRRSLVALLAVAIALPAAAQEMHGEHDEGMMSFHKEQISDIETMKGKFVSLAEAMPADKWDWRPMEGVRSVAEVAALIVAEGYLFPTIWGTDAPAGVASGFGAEMQRIGAMEKDAVIGEMEKAFDHMIASLEEMEYEDHMREVQWFGRPVTVTAAISLAAGDMHEHLGQSIAYARTNRVVPPWSAGGGQ